MVAAIQKADCTPILSDVTLNGFNMDIERAKALIDEDTLALLFPYMFGLPQDLRELNNFCKNKGVYLIEAVSNSQSAYMALNDSFLNSITIQQLK